jgi:ATP-dependent DNA helicase RecQ
MNQINIFDFPVLQETLEDWHQLENFVAADYQSRSALYGRIHQILLRSIEQNIDPSFSDLAPLLRQILMQRHSAGSPSKLRIPKLKGWPGRDEWESYGFACIEHPKTYVINPCSWHPYWLNLELPETEDVFADCFAELPVRKDAEVPIDPFLKGVTGYDTYLCPGQREAVRSLLFMKAGSTLIVNLPTGAGKTDVALAPLLVERLRLGLTLFIIPTTALALDQARRMEDLLKKNMPTSNLGPLAWHGELNDYNRQTIKTNIRQGTQGILFASPEAVAGALLPALYDANKAGLLRYFVIDEAHLVAQWGDSFRPAFQALSGVRRGLLRNCGGEAFRTVLMSATFSPQTIETLDALFGPSDNIQMVSAIHLRPEPRYWAYKARDKDEKRSSVMELLKHAPRPFILYVTERKDAVRWTQDLRDIGNFRRIECFNGDTPNDRREQIIRKWVDNELDGIVATSAFGVGMDKLDVRTIIHATVPESLDRFYQEVGRGGRDGKASLSVTIYTDEDVDIGRRLSSPSLIGDENAYTRWQTMFMAADHSQAEDTVSLDLTVPPPHLQQQTDFNVSWNMRTLILMARAGMVELDSRPPAALERLSDEDEAAYEARTDAEWTEFYNSMPVRTLDPQHLKMAHFQNRITSEQNKGRNAARRSFDLLLRALDGRLEMGAALASQYENHQSDREVFVSKVCSGCPADKQLKQSLVDYTTPPGIGIQEIRNINCSAWSTDFPMLPTTTVIFYPSGVRQIDDLLEIALNALVGHYGVREIVAREKLWNSDPSLVRLHRASPDRVVVGRYLEDGNTLGNSLPLPRATLLLPWGIDPVPNDIFLLDRPLHVIFAPEDIQGDYPHKRRFETDPNSLMLEQFLKVAAQ